MPRGDAHRLYRAGSAGRRRNSVRDRARRRHRARRLARTKPRPRTITHRLGEIHERLIAIDAYAAPARAARILVGLGFDEEMQQRPLDSYSGGWKMRVALAALLFSEPDLLLLDEPSNHLDLEATLWLENFLKILSAHDAVISHERDLLNNVVDNILHLEGGKTHALSGRLRRFETPACRAARPARLGRAPARRRSAPSCRIISPATAPAPRPPSRPSRAPRCWRGCSRSRRWPRIRA